LPHRRRTHRFAVMHPTQRRQPPSPLLLSSHADKTRFNISTFFTNIPFPAFSSATYVSGMARLYPRSLLRQSSAFIRAFTVRARVCAHMYLAFMPLPPRARMFSASVNSQHSLRNPRTAPLYYLPGAGRALVISVYLRRFRYRAVSYRYIESPIADINRYH